MATVPPFTLGDCVGVANGGNITLSTGTGADPRFSVAANLVTNHVQISEDYADQAFNNAWCFLTGLANYAPVLNDLTYEIDFDEVTIPTPVFQKPDAPDEPDIALYVPTFPAAFVPGAIHQFDENAIGTVPTFGISEPLINLPSTPGTLDVEAPTDAPDIQTEFDFPDTPVYTLPSVPTFEDLNLPTAPDLDIPSFDLDLPTIPSYLTPPGLTFNFQEELYTSSLLTALTSELLDRVQNGGTGLSPTIEQAIWDRARNREDQNSVRSTNQLSIEQAARGFSRPSGSYLAALDQLSQETQNKNADLSREIAIKQADLEQKNIEFALQTSLALEQSLIQYHNQVQQRAFEFEKYFQEAAIAIYEANIRQFGLQLEVYKTYSQAFESRVRAELAKTEIFKSEIEAQRLISDINNQKVQLYTAQLEGIKTSVQVYLAEIDATKSQIQAESLKLQNFKALIDIFATQVESKKSEYDMYSAAVKGEMAKIDIFDSQVKAFVSRVDAYSKQVDVETMRIESDIKVEGLRLQEYLTRLDTIVKNVQAQSEVSKSQIELFRSKAAMYSAEVDAESSRLDAESKVYDLTLRKAQYAAEVELKNATISIENAKNSVSLILEALKSGAQVGSGLAQAALSSINIGASLGHSSSNNYNESHTYQEK